MKNVQHRLLLALLLGISLTSPFQITSGIIGDLAVKIKFGPNDARKELDGIEKELNKLREKFTKNKLTDVEALTLTLSDNKERAARYAARQKDGDLTEDDLLFFLKAAHRLDERPTLIDITQLLPIIKKQASETKTSGKFSQSTGIRLTDIESLTKDIAELQQKMKDKNVDDSTVSSNNKTVQDLSDDLKALKTLLTNARNYNISIIKDVCGIPLSTDGTLDNNKTSWAGRIYKKAVKFEDECDSATKIKAKHAADAYTFFYGDSMTKEVVQDKYLDRDKGPFNMDIQTDATSYFGVPLKDIPAAYKEIELHSRAAVIALKQFAAQSKLFSDSSKPENSAWFATARTLISSYLDKVTLGGFKLISARLALKDITEKIKNCLNELETELGLRNTSNKVTAADSTLTDLGDVPAPAEYKGLVDAYLAANPENINQLELYRRNISILTVRKFDGLTSDKKTAIKSLCSKADAAIRSLYTKYSSLLASSDILKFTTSPLTAAYVELNVAEFLLRDLMTITSCVNTKMFNEDAAKNAPKTLLNLIATLTPSENTIKSLATSNAEQQEAVAIESGNAQTKFKTAEVNAAAETKAGVLSRQSALQKEQADFAVKQKAALDALAGIYLLDDGRTAKIFSENSSPATDILFIYTIPNSQNLCIMAESTGNTYLLALKNKSKNEFTVASSTLNPDARYKMVYLSPLMAEKEKQGVINSLATAGVVQRDAETARQKADMLSIITPATVDENLRITFKNGDSFPITGVRLSNQKTIKSAADSIEVIYCKNDSDIEKEYDKTKTIQAANHLFGVVVSGTLYPATLIPNPVNPVEERILVLQDTKARHTYSRLLYGKKRPARAPAATSVAGRGVTPDSSGTEIEMTSIATPTHQADEKRGFFANDSISDELLGAFSFDEETSGINAFTPDNRTPSGSFDSTTGSIGSSDSRAGSFSEKQSLTDPAQLTKDDFKANGLVVLTNPEDQKKLNCSYIQLTGTDGILTDPTIPTQFTIGELLALNDGSQVYIKFNVSPTNLSYNTTSFYFSALSPSPRFLETKVVHLRQSSFSLAASTRKKATLTISFTQPSPAHSDLGTPPADVIW